MMITSWQGQLEAQIIPDFISCLVTFILIGRLMCMPDCKHSTVKINPTVEGNELQWEPENMIYSLLLSLYALHVLADAWC